MYKIIFFVPVNESEKVKNSMFDVGAGKIGNYDCCSFQTLGIGQFKALDGANPFIGKVGKIEKVEELKIEMICQEKYLKLALKALKDNHPYEMPAYDIIKLIDL